MKQQLDLAVEDGLQDHVQKRLEDIEGEARRVLLETAQKETEDRQHLTDLQHDIDAVIQHEFDILMEDKVTNARLNVDVERRSLEQQIQELVNSKKILVEKRQHEKLTIFDKELKAKQNDLAKEADDAHRARIEAHRSQCEEKKKSLLADIQAAEARRSAASASQTEAYHGAITQTKAIDEDLSSAKRKMNEDTLAILRGLRDGSLRDAARANKHQSLPSCGEEADMDIDDNGPGHGGPAPPDVLSEIGDKEVASTNEEG
ncbi:hypothetical protein ARMGADRAFT_1093609 [Armillaria gallica]|uniref:Uncharacterized protein n=1 Tax=Armillaria gallica TaxID=47427 RepID=A0A2H3C7C1_ARMGA|nr:hypothetical protein ARMGADRAFT_1093609 [Armillaria gallica]